MSKIKTQLTFDALVSNYLIKQDANYVMEQMADKPYSEIIYPKITS